MDFKHFLIDFKPKKKIANKKITFIVITFKLALNYEIGTLNLPTNESFLFYIHINLGSIFFNLNNV